MTDAPDANPSIWRLYSRAVRLRCPACGTGRLFRTWFSMHRRCERCDLDFHREPGFYLGSIYVNYGLTAALVSAAYMVCFLNDWFAEPVRLTILLAFSILFPLWFFRPARALWLAFDYRWDPPEKR